jgi:3-oxoacyl-(acyl-carrier-protein) synthase/malonyl CoA-acyl carrier protein transacylase/phosphopantetheinyl transferase (holo-ACP synthase)
MRKEGRDIAIVGMSVFCPAGETVDEFWRGIVSGGDFITEVPSDVIEELYFSGEPNGRDRFYCGRGGFSSAFKLDPLRYGILPIIADGVDPDQLISMAGVDWALNDAGVFKKETSLEKCSIIIGKGNFSGLIALRCLEIIRTSHEVTNLLKAALPALTEGDLEKIRRAYQESKGRFQADMAIGTMPNLVASLVANRFDMHGPAYTVDAACASGIVAVNHSVALLRSGECDIAVAGAMHTGQSAAFWTTFDMMGAMSRRQQSTPFSKDADGLIVGQGGGFVVLKTLQRAQQDGDRIYAVIKDTAVSSDGAGTHVTVTSTKGQLRVLKKAWGSTGMNPQDIGYIEAHGTSTPVGDKIEITTLKEFFGDNTHPQAFVGSVKSNIGHAMAAAGIIGIIKTALALYHRTIPPTLHCEEPLSGMFDSRFLPPQEAIPWDGDKYPLVAGVNAFGFGGINSHAILTAYEPESGASSVPRSLSQSEEALLISAPDKESLLTKLKTGDYTDTGGDYRLAMFAPDKARIKQAIAIVEKDVSWRGRLDIWFSNHPLLTEGGKIAFLVPGFGPEASETDSISESLGLAYIESLVDTGPETTEYSRGIHRCFCAEYLCKEGLEKLGVEADMYAGHSFGEWQATTFAGMMESNWNRLSQQMALWADWEAYPLIAVGGTNAQVAESWCAEIEGLYLSNDNCPSQVLLCGTPPAVEALQERLDEAGLFSTVLPYGTGYHTPLFAKVLDSNEGALDDIAIHEGTVPVWSATTLEQIPTDLEEYKELVTMWLTRPVYFRSLIEKLYDEQGARVFIQIGPGALVGFVGDTLKGREFSAVASATPDRSGIGQLRRVLAALFVEGREVDAEFLGVSRVYQAKHSLMIMRRGAPPVLNDLPELQEAISRRYGASGFVSAPGIPAAADETLNPLARAVNENLLEAVKTQNELFALFEQCGYSAQGAASATASVTATDAVPPTPVPPAPAREGFEESLRLTFEDHPYLVDHSIIRQPAGWEHREDLNLVVPFTMTIELLAEIAQRHAPGRRLLKAGKIAAYQWITLEEPFEETLTGVWKDADTLALNLEGFAQAEFTFGETCPEPPTEYVGDIDIGESIDELLTAEQYYDRFAFHGPQYRSSTIPFKVCSRGLATWAEKQAGKGSLLDVMGQQLGLFLHLTQAENTISFPVRLKELNFYTDVFDQEGVFEHTMVITRLTDSVIAANMVFKRDGAIWCVARDFVCQRFQNSASVWPVILKPQLNLLAEELAPGLFYYANTNPDSILNFLEKRYLNHWEQAERPDGISRERWREHLFGRIALKDAVRDRLRSPDAIMPYPIEISCARDEKGKPFVVGHGELAGALEGLHVSLSHKGNEAVAIVSDAPVGIDIEKVEDRGEDFLKVAFSEGERALLGDEPRPEAVTSFWVAKEACAKKTGEGLVVNPRRFEVCAIIGDVLTIGNEQVQVRAIGEGCLVGWTL